MYGKCLTGIIVCLLALTISRHGNAVEPGEGVDSQVLLISPGTSNFVSVSSADIEAHRQVMFAAVAHYYRKPLSVELAYASGEKETHFLVKDVLSTDFVWAFGLLDVMQLGLVMPVVMYQNGKGRAVAGLMPADGEKGEFALSSSALKDIRFHVKTRFLGGDAALPDRRGLGLAFDFGMAVPSGDEKNFAGERGFLFLPNLIVDYRMCKFSAALNVGARLRTQKGELGLSEVNHQGAAGLGVTGHYLDRRFLISGELHSLTNLSELKETTFEYRGALGYVPDEARSVTLWLAGGSAFGSADVMSIPQFRMLFSISYAPGGDDVEESTF